MRWALSKFLFLWGFVLLISIECEFPLSGPPVLLNSKLVLHKQVWVLEEIWLIHFVTSSPSHQALCLGGSNISCILYCMPIYLLGHTTYYRYSMNMSSDAGIPSCLVPLMLNNKSLPAFVFYLRTSISIFILNLGWDSSGDLLKGSLWGLMTNVLCNTITVHIISSIDVWGPLEWCVGIMLAWFGGGLSVGWVMLFV